jgi:hypothetical protein
MRFITAVQGSASALGNGSNRVYGWRLQPLDRRTWPGTRKRLIPVLEVFDLPAPYQPFNPEIQGQLSGDDFTNSSTRQEPVLDI